MAFKMPEYRKPDLESEPFTSFPDAALAPVEKAGVAPEGFHATTIYPEYIKLAGEWALLRMSRMDSVVVVTGGEPEVKEFRRLEAGEAGLRLEAGNDR